MMMYENVFGSNAKGLHLKPGTKFPEANRHPHGYHDAIPLSEIQGSDWAFVLDGIYIVFDLDYPALAPPDILERFPETYTQITKKGRHLVYKLPPNFEYFLPNGERKYKNTKLYHEGNFYADIRITGYMVGSGSTLAGHTYTDNGKKIQESPPWLLDKLELAKDKEKTSTNDGTGRRGVPSGSHDEFLFQLASWARGRADLSEEAIQRLLYKGPLNVLEDQDEKNPYDKTHIARIARSAARYAPLNALEHTSLAPSSWKTALEVDTTLPLIDWVLHGFVPRNRLSLIYGRGSVGKSTLASWLVAKALSQGLTVGYAGIEEPFELFVVRVSMSGFALKPEDFSRLFDVGNEWRFPEHGEKLHEALEQCHLDMLYFDSIYTHFGNVQGHEGVRARECLSPLASIAQEMNVTILGTFHENKTGNFMGSEEMRNVARVLLRASRAKNKPLILEIDKTNFTDPGYALQFNSILRPAHSLDGQPWKERNENGEIVTVEFHVVSDFIKLKDEEVYELEDFEEPPDYQIRALLTDNPDLPPSEIARELGWTKKKTQYWLDKIGSGAP